MPGATMQGFFVGLIDGRPLTDPLSVMSAAVGDFAMASAFSRSRFKPELGESAGSASSQAESVVERSPDRIPHSESVFQTGSRGEEDRDADAPASNASATTSNNHGFAEFIDFSQFDVSIPQAPKVGDAELGGTGGEGGTIGDDGHSPTSELANDNRPRSGGADLDESVNESPLAANRNLAVSRQSRWGVIPRPHSPHSAGRAQTAGPA